MKKIASLALLSALAISSIVPAAHAAEQVPSTTSNVIESGTFIANELQTVKIKFTAVSGAEQYWVRVLKGKNEVVNEYVNSNSSEFEAEVGVEYKIWVGAIKNGKIIQGTDPNFYATITKGQKSVSLDWKKGLVQLRAPF